MSFRDYPWRYALFFMAYYAANSVFQGYMSLYYAARGLDAARIGAWLYGVCPRRVERQ